MRLWHKDLIDVLPKQQLVAQWRECCAIMRNISVKGSPNHILVNRIMDYPIQEFWVYAKKVYDEMAKRGYSCNFYSFAKWCSGDMLTIHDCKKDNIFSNWHNKRYFWQCYSNLEEKYDCGTIPEDEWARVEERMQVLLPF